MKKMITSFVVAGALTIGNISAIASEYITKTVDIITQIDSKEKIKKNHSVIVEYLDYLKESDEEFQNKVMTFMVDNYKNIDSFLLGKRLSEIALAIEGRNMRYDIMMNIFKKDKVLIHQNKKLIELKNNNNSIKKQIQELINLVFLHIEAKNNFALAKEILKTKKIENLVFKDYWYISELQDEDKSLFISIENNEDIDLEKIYSLEDEINKQINDMAEMKKNTFKQLKVKNEEQIGGYNFDAMHKIFFKRVSIV